MQRLMQLLGAETTMELVTAKRKTVAWRTGVAQRSHVLTSVPAATRMLTTQVMSHDLASIKTLQRRWRRTSASSQASTQSMTPATQTMTRAS